MARQKKSENKSSKRFAWIGAIILSFIVAFEIVIMISPFAFFFYTVFNPFLRALNQSSLTRWLTAFFLPHMVAPPNEVLTAIRILGSIFFVAGMLIFFVCAAQVYIGKLLKKGVATKGLYTIIRHPQYVGLGFAALGLAIMWPRFLTLALFAIMLFLYYLLARDEERRMTNRFGESYIAYMDRTGMFFPHFIERELIGGSKSQQRLSFGKAILVFAALLVAAVGSGFILRAYTVHHLPVRQVGGVDVIAITKEDLLAAEQLLPSVLQAPAVASKLQPYEKNKDHRILAYFIPIDYVMQGMIADTGAKWKLFEQHKTIGMITQFILHPFGHLTGGHTGHAAMGGHALSMHDSPAMKRRIIFVEISGNDQNLTSPFDDFDINIMRKPLFFADVHLHTGEILQVQNTPAGSGWGTVPTPIF
jgi:protein-S-isoprenylcysteine O-methyltransferase Ste14